ncbi:MAG: hypothetical protein KAG61_13935 [Bacteriovoracaceae bacterium]|nr:hypothetical protein [Bacteriovoracaceae bacterium]
MILAICPTDDHFWEIAYEGNSISKHSSFDEAEKIAALLSVELYGKIEVLNTSANLD